MKKLMKKLMVIVMAVTMMFVMAIPVFADDTETSTVNLTITHGQLGSVYNAYLVMDAKEIGTSGLYTYEPTESFKSALGKSFTVQSVGKTYYLNDDNEICNVSQNGTVYTPITSAEDITAVAGYLSRFVIENEITSNAEIVILNNAGEQGNVLGTAQNLAKGYYLVRQDVVPKGYVASKPILVALTGDKEVSAKDEKLSLDKSITGENGVDVTPTDNNSVQIGDTVNYTVTTAIPTWGADVKKDSISFWFEDTFAEGLTYQEDVQVYIGDSTTPLSTTEKDANDQNVLTVSDTENGFTVSLSSATAYANQGKAVKLTYSGILNEKAVVDNGNENEVKLTYTNNSKGGTDYLTDKVITYTYGFGIEKIDATTKVELNGAKFQLKDIEGNIIKMIAEDGGYRVAKVIDAEGNYEENALDDITVNGNTFIRGLDAGAYLLHETAAPSISYAKAEDIWIEIAEGGETGTEELNGFVDIFTETGFTKSTLNGIANEDAKSTKEGTVYVVVEDARGISLPETGSKAAMCCTVGGIILVAAGGLFFGLSKRKKTTK